MGECSVEVGFGLAGVVADAGVEVDEGLSVFFILEAFDSFLEKLHI